ncbi:hypothetical protein GCM10009557_05870 [Virgisporangium ochraceum]|uniref:Tail terminator n=1 Tax=Virgisporangium ochraceum TaxID=65505 RepID=A0A8J3ZKZ2_9ACTN|nr:minor capsid protein [Virgisporangium ochraceum]GIJ66244.1 hypothetical protein Voc01_011610 [Virgisporangium ochraceum]
MGWVNDLLEGLAQLLADEGVGTWRPTGVYQPTETGIYLAATPPDPARAIVLASYPVDDNVALPHVVTAVQVRTRAGPDPTAVHDLDDLVYEQLHGLTYQTFGTAHIKQMWRRSSAALGQVRDGRDLWEITSNYYADAARPTAHRPI